MKRTLILFFLISAALTAATVRPAYSYWIWTPKTGKFVNPKAEPKSTPAEQLSYSQGLLEKKNYEGAKREFEKLLKSYPKAAEAAEAQYYLGVIEETLSHPYEAFKAYQKVVEKYPFSERITGINEQEFKIAEEFMAGTKRKALGMALPVENPALEILAKVVENAPFGPLAAKAQYKLGLVYKSLSRFEEAEEAFGKVVSSYPDSEWAEPSKFQLATAKAGISKGSDYDQGATKEAKEKFEEFVKSNPDAELSKEAEKNISRLKDTEAESAFNTGRFYEKQKQFEPARIYYENIIDNNKDSVWAAKALERIQIMENKKK